MPNYTSPKLHLQIVSFVHNSSKCKTLDLVLYIYLYIRNWNQQMSDIQSITFSWWTVADSKKQMSKHHRIFCQNVAFSSPSKHHNSVDSQHLLQPLYGFMCTLRCLRVSSEPGQTRTDKEELLEAILLQ